MSFRSIFGHTETTEKEAGIVVRASMRLHLPSEKLSRSCDSSTISNPFAEGLLCLSAQNLIHLEDRFGVLHS